MKGKKKVVGCSLQKKQSSNEHSMLYKAFSEELGRDVMIKLLDPRYPADSRTARRFLRGGELACSMEHPNVVRTYSSGRDQRNHYMLMEFLEGHSLDRIIGSNNHIHYKAACDIVRQVAMALEYAYGKGVIHRKIEPAHIMISPGGRVSMLGFGLARLVESNNNITAEGALVGIGPYSCPESGMEKADITGDIYSLGAVFYHMLAGRPPFLGRDALDYLYKHRNEEVWPVRDLASSAMPKAVDELVNAMLDKNKKTRIQTPSELIACIDAIISPDVIRVKEDKKPRKESTIVFTTREMIASRRDYNIIIYDSHDYCRRLIHEVLFRQGFVSNVASSVDEINKFTDENKPDAVFIDVPAGVAGVEKILKKIILLNSEVAIVLTRGGSMAQKLFDKISSDESYKGEVSILQRPLEAESVRRSAYIGLKIGR